MESNTLQVEELVFFFPVEMSLRKYISNRTNGEPSNHGHDRFSLSRCIRREMRLIPGTPRGRCRSPTRRNPGPLRAPTSSLRCRHSPRGSSPLDAPPKADRRPCQLPLKSTEVHARAYRTPGNPPTQVREATEVLATTTEVLAMTTEVLATTTEVLATTTKVPAPVHRCPDSAESRPSPVL